MSEARHPSHGPPAPNVNAPTAHHRTHGLPASGLDAPPALHSHNQHHTTQRHPHPPSRTGPHTAHAVPEEHMISSDPVPLPHLKYQMHLFPSSSSSFRSIDSSLTCSTAIGFVRCLEAFCPLGSELIRWDLLAGHLELHHCWGQRALGALPRPTKENKKHTSYFCLLTGCTPSISSAKGQTALEFSRKHKDKGDHPCIVVPRTHPHDQFSGIAPDLLLSSLQGLKAFMWRIEDWLSNLGHHLRQDEYHTLGYNEFVKKWKDIKPTIVDIMQNIPPASLTAKLQLPVTKIFAIHEGLKMLSAPYQTRTDFVCVCQEVFNLYTSLGPHKGRFPNCRDQPHGLSAVPVHSRHEEQKSHHAANSIAWLIRTEMAYIEQQFNPRHSDHDDLIEQLRQYAHKLSTEVALHWDREDLLAILSRDLQRLRSQHDLWNLQRLRSEHNPWTEMEVLKLEPLTARNTDEHHRSQPYVSLKRLLAYEAHQPSDYAFLTRCMAEANFDYGYPCFHCYTGPEKHEKHVWYFLYEYMHHIHHYHSADRALQKIVTSVGSEALAVPKADLPRKDPLSFRNILWEQWSAVILRRAASVVPFDDSSQNQALTNIKARYSQGAAMIDHKVLASCELPIMQMGDDLSHMENLVKNPMARLYDGQCPAFL